ncbi:hypothetical protein ACTFIZ_011176 [Dictyostelium cf. discoideum]
MSLGNIQSNLNQTSSKGWDKTAQIFLNNFSKPNGFTTLFAIDAINLSIPKENQEKPMKILDIACGTGPLTIAASEIFKNSKFIATDFSPNMIEILNKIIKENHLKNIETHIMDGQNLISIENEAIDYTFSIFGLIFFPDLIKGMKEMYRVLKPNNQSRTAIASWCSDSFLPEIFRETLNQLLTEQNNGKPTTYKQLASSLSNELQFKNHLESVGFIDVSITRVEHPLEVNELSDLSILLKSNPAYIDCLDLLHTDELKLKFDSLFIEIAKSKNPIRSLENNKLQLKSYSFIGVGTKL